MSYCKTSQFWCDQDFLIQDVPMSNYPKIRPLLSKIIPTTSAERGTFRLRFCKYSDIPNFFHLLYAEFRLLNW